MKTSLLVLLLSGVIATAFAQTDYKKAPLFGVSYFLNDFQTAADLRAGGLANVIKDKQWHKTKRMKSGLALNYMQGLCSHVDLSATLAGSFVDYPIPNKVSDGDNYLLLEGFAQANLKMVTDKYWFNPFLSLGVGASKYKGYFGAFIPMGVGLQFNIYNNAFILLNSQYRIPVTENVAYHFYHSIGIAANIQKKKPMAAPASVEVPAEQETPKEENN